MGEACSPWTRLRNALLSTLAMDQLLLVDLRREAVLRPFDPPDLLRERLDEPDDARPLVPPELFDEDALAGVRLAAGFDDDALEDDALEDDAFDCVRLASGLDDD